MLALLAWVPGLILLGGVVFVVSTQFVQERRFARLLARAQPGWFLLAAVLQAGTYLTTGLAWRIPLRSGARRISLWTGARLALVKLTLDQAVPTGGVSGTVAVVRHLRRRGIGVTALGRVLVVELVGYYLAYSVAVFGGLAVLWFDRRLDTPVAVAATVFAVGAAVVPMALVWLIARRGWRPGRNLRRIPWLASLADETLEGIPDLRRAWKQILETAGCYLATLLLDAITLAVMLLAVGTQPALHGCFAALVMGQVAATLGIMPGGLGTFEAATIAVLTVTGTDTASALSATLLLRGFTFWLPMLPGLFLVRSGRRRRA